MDYQPKPIDTNNVLLPPEILAIAEKLAENTHEVWAQRRIRDGWTYGSARDDSSKKHPGLVPYIELTEAEKEYDRGTALETLKLILLMGYRLVAEGSI